MKKVTYQCNLCTEQSPKENMIALYFKSDISPQRYVLDKSKVDECDKHICTKCVSLIMSDGARELLQDF